MSNHSILELEVWKSDILRPMWFFCLFPPWYLVCDRERAQHVSSQPQVSLEWEREGQCHLFLDILHPHPMPSATLHALHIGSYHVCGCPGSWQHQATSSFDIALFYICQYHASGCPGSLRHQDIGRHTSEYRRALEMEWWMWGCQVTVSLRNHSSRQNGSRITHGVLYCYHRPEVDTERVPYNDKWSETSSSSWEGITSPLCGEFTGHRWIPHTKDW